MKALIASNRKAQTETTIYKAIIIVFTLLLSACSSVSNPNTVSEISRLQKDFSSYKHSNYVTANLKTSTPNNKNTQYTAQQSLTYQSKLNSVKRNLTSKKKQAGAKLDIVILHNGLYTPSPALNYTLSTLPKNVNAKYENWLQNNSSLKAVLAVALKNNIDIKSNYQQAQANLTKYDQVSFLDDMLAQYASFTKDLELTGSNQKHSKSVSNGFPFPGLLALKASIVDQAVYTSQLVLKQTVQDVITKTRIAYYELQLAQQEKNLSKRNGTLLKNLKQEIENNYSTNTADLSGIVEADIEIEKNKNTFQTAKEKQLAKQASLNALLNLSPTFTLGKLDRIKPEKLTLSKNNLIRNGTRHRVEITKLQSELKKMEQIIQLSEKRFYPDFNAGYSRYQSLGSKQGFSNKPKIKTNNFFAKNDSYLSETKLKYKALSSRINALKKQTEDNIQQTFSKYKTQKRTYSLYQRKILPKARTALDIAKNQYETGETSYGKIINAEESILKYRLLSLKALTEMNVNSAKLKRLVGKQ